MTVWIWRGRGPQDRSWVRFPFIGDLASFMAFPTFGAICVGAGLHELGAPDWLSIPIFLAGFVPVVQVLFASSSSLGRGVLPNFEQRTSRRYGIPNRCHSRCRRPQCPVVGQKESKLLVLPSNRPGRKYSRPLVVKRARNLLRSQQKFPAERLSAPDNVE